MLIYEDKNPTITPEPDKGDKEHLDIVDAYKHLQETTVSKEDYEKLQREHTEVIQRIMNGEPIDTLTPEEQKSAKELGEKLFGQKEELTNLEYIQITLAYRDAMLREGKGDVFLPRGVRIAPTDQDIAAVEKVAEGLKQMVEECQGNPEAFNIAYQARVIDPKLF